MKRKITSQQLQTKKFFEKNANNWAREAKLKSNKIQNPGHSRSKFVLDSITKNRFKYHLDVGCGTGDLVFNSSRFTKKSVGLDFSKNMIKIAKKKFKRKNLFFENSSVFNFKTKEKFDIISANGFIEYISINQIKSFLKFCQYNLVGNGLIILSVRNRLFNLFSLNDFTEKELKEKMFMNFLKESINLNRLGLKEFLRLKKIKFNKSSFNQPKTENYNIDVRLQFSPLQMINVLNQYNFNTVDIFPINYHPVTPKIFSTQTDFFKISKYITKNCDKLSLIPFSSSFMIAAKKIKK
tara:strand:+ start:512 stop:1396 length:885 start_codon:yes stop_codon:yes gene_type:complete